jgi:Helix-turn-helix domain
MDKSLPLLLTVEEAGEVLRIGRTKAYAMAREWRVTEGRSGLPVIDLGNVLRVPRRALEDLIGTELTGVPHGHHAAPADSGTSESTPAITRPHLNRPARRRAPDADDEQLDLFAVRAPTS